MSRGASILQTASMARCASEGGTAAHQSIWAGARKRGVAREAARV
jgi:hypothetical protein